MTRLMVIGGLLALSTFALADKGKEPAAAGAATLTPAADLKWADVPGFKGVKLATADGDPSKGPAHFYLKFVAGFAAPLHHHSADHYGTVVSGTLVLNVDGKDVKLPPGSFFGFTKAKPHMTSCAAGADCVLAMDAHDKWDVVPEATAKK
jgi:mannose-6-phosphate isomerase-like protein (cupin superfamily)